MNRINQCSIVFLTMMWIVSWGNLRAQSVRYVYDDAGNRINRSVSPLNSPQGGASFSFDSLTPPLLGEAGRGSFVEKVVDGEVIYQYQPYAIELLPERVNGAVHDAIFLPEPGAEAATATMSVAPASFASVPNAVTIDRTKAVGEIPISSNVSNGAAIYTIPVEIYPGRHGFQPEISLTYNSMSGNGVAGYGWHLTGLSAITPVHSSYYYDGEAALAEQMAMGAAYSLDGMRLIRKSSGVYQSEQGFIKATIEDHSSKYFFTVTFPDGRTATYGYTTSTTPQVSYPLTSIKDKAGNTVTYTYQKVSNMYLVTEISYMHKTTVIGKVKFTYTTRTDGITHYKAGNAIKPERLLSAIEVYHSNTLLRTYTCEYVLNEYNFLSRVRCKAGTQELNPLSFYYGTGSLPSPSLSESTSFLSSYFPSGSVKNILHKFKYNNLVVQDGLVAYPEFVTYGVTATDRNGNCSYGSLYDPSQKLLIYSNMTGVLTTPTSQTAGTGFQGLYPADINGDGKDELVKINYFYNSGATSRLQLTTYSQSLSPSSYTYDLLGRVVEGSLNSPSPRAFLTGNFTGDGRATMVAVSGSKTPKNVAAGTYVTLIDMQSGTILSNTQPFTYDHFQDAVFAMDFTGDGRTELCLVNNTGLHIYSCRNKTFTKLITYSGITSTDLRSHNKKMLLGDLNGDGKTDIILSPRYNPFNWTQVKKHTDLCYGCCNDPRNLEYQTANEWYYKCMADQMRTCHIKLVSQKSYLTDAYNWTFYLSTGTGFTYSNVRYPFTNEDENSFLLHDVNGDQLPDLVVKNGSYLSVFLNNKGSISTTASTSRVVNASSYLIPAVAGDSWRSDNRMSQLLVIKDATVSSITYNRNDGLQRKLSGAVNSLGVINKIRYVPMSEPEVYTANASSYLPYNTIFMNEPLVRQQEVWYNNEQIENAVYKYENGTIHRQGLGFSGFRKITMTDQVRSTSTVTTYDPAYNGMMTSLETPAFKQTLTYNRLVDASKFLTLQIASKTDWDKLNQISPFTRYQYDDYNNITSEVTTYGFTETVTITNKYNNSPHIGELYDQTVKTTRSGQDWTTRMQIPSFHATTRQPLKVLYSVNGNQVKEVTNSYNTDFDLTQVVEKPYASTKTLTTKFEYDLYGRITKETSPLNLATTYGYHTTTGELATSRNHKNKQISYEYDPFSRLVKTTYPDATIETNALAWVTAPAGAVYLTTVAATGKPTGRVYYDPFHREVRKGAVSFDGTYTYTDYQYNARERFRKESQPFRGSAPTAWTTYTFDPHGRPLKIESPSGTLQTWTYAAGTVTTRANGVAETRNFDISGKLVSLTDTAGTITYTIRPDGQPSYIIAPGNIRTDFTYDTYGRRSSFTDPSYGVTNYIYNTEGLLHKETNANNKTTEYLYDAYLRLETKKLSEFTVTYAYNSDGLLRQETTNNSTSTVYTYDDLLRLTQVRENAPDNKWLQREWTYTGGNVSSVKYTSHTGVIGTENLTYANGNLTERKLGTTSFFKLTAQNNLGQPTTLTTGGVTRTYGYTAHGVMNGRSAKTGSTTFQNFSYDVDAIKGNLKSRTDSKYNRSESFEYDNLNRLKKYGTNTVTFDMKGNILTKTDAGTLSYATDGKPYAVSGATNPASAIPARAQAVTYTSFSRPDKITENNYTATFTYNGSYERVKMHLLKGTARELTRYYLGGCYEIDETGTSNVKEKLYIGGDYYSAPAVYIKENSGAWQLYNICRDHLGSITHLTNSSGSAVTQELSFDAWGRLRNPSTQVGYAPGSEPALFLGRGYTGHEHLPWFGLVNMNARLYDPVTGRFLAPDPHVQNPELSQNYNRYAYALNNPLVYKDENGEFIFTILSAIFCPVLLPAAIGADLGLWAGGSMANGTINPFKWDYSSGQTWGYMAGGAVMGGLSGWAGGAIAGSGIPFANTASIAGASLINSAGTSLYTGGKTDISMSFGIGSFNFSKGQFGYLGKSGNKWYENMGYAFGAMANGSDILRGFKDDVVQLQTEMLMKDKIGHSQLLDINNNSLIDFGPGGSFWGFDQGMNNWIEYASHGTITQTIDIAGNLIKNPLYIKGINLNILQSYSKLLNDKPGFYNFLLRSCSSQVARGLTMAGVPVWGVHPYLLHAQIAYNIRPYMFNYMYTR